MKTILKEHLKHTVILSIILFGMMLTITNCERQAIKKPLDEVTVQLNWRLQAQFAGFYAADQHGFYADEGMAITLLPRSDPTTDVFAQVLDGTADFGLTSGINLVAACSRGKPVTAIAAIYRRSPRAFLTLASSGITRPHDFPGHTMRALSPGFGRAVYQAMMAHLGLDPNSVQRIETGYDLAPFFSGEVEIWLGYLIDEVIIAREQGYQVNLILTEDYGVHDYANALFTTEQLIQENPDLVLRFLRATLRGWRWAVENPEEAGALALKYNPTLNRAHEVALMEASVPLIHTGEDQIGWMQSEVWQGTYNILMEQEILAGPLNVDQVYTMTFLHKVYREE